jgi:hypothetical protein
MRKILITVMVLISMAGSNCGNNSNKQSLDSGPQADSTRSAELIFRDYEHNFGKVMEGEKIAYVFTFENRGSGNLIITNVTTSCGCTVPKYDTKPIPPGKNGNLEVAFNTSGYNGMQTKTIAVKSNASIPVVLLKITAEVVTNDGK